LRLDFPSVKAITIEMGRVLAKKNTKAATISRTGLPAPNLSTSQW
jgi:hypothetical protein